MSIKTVLQPLPAPLIASGISESTLSAFSGELKELGVTVMNGPGGASSTELSGQIEAGSAVSAILMQGDFNFGATGTVYTCGRRSVISLRASIFPMGLGGDAFGPG